MSVGTRVGIDRRGRATTRKKPGRPSRPKRGALRAGRRAQLIVVTRVAVVLAILGLWQFLSGRVVEAYLISNPIDVAKKLVVILGDGARHHDIMVTGKELVAGWTIGAVTGAVVGWAFGAVKFLGEVMEPIVNAINGIPKVSLAPMFLLWFGLGMGSKIAIASMIVFFLVFYNVFAGMRSVPQSLVDVAKVMGASRWFVIRKVVAPSVAVPLFAALKAGVPLAMIGVIAGEYVSAQEGLGFYTMTATQQFDPAGLFAAVMIIVAMVVVGCAIIGFFERRALAWQRD
ncbi:MAG: transporter permease [Actinoallomurus sp.]|jgi:NitT/TauT family transport system permease protein|nr:transporter permease [Actinoallomurus sp.]